MSNKTLIISLSVVLLLCGMGLAIASGGKPWFWLGEERAKINAMPGADAVVALVEGEEVTRGDLIYWQRAVELGNRVSGMEEPTDAKTVFYEHIVPMKAAAALAKKEGLWPSDRETREYIAVIRSQFEMSGDAQAELEDYLTGLGMTEDEFFGEYAFEGYRQSMAMGYYSQKISAQFTGKSPDEVMALTQSHMADLGAKAQVRIVDPSL